MINTTKSPSEDFLDFVRGLARNQDLAGIAVAFQFYCRARPASRTYVLGRLPAILANHYFTRRKDLDYNKFIDWCVRHATAWSEMGDFASRRRFFLPKARRLHGPSRRSRELSVGGRFALESFEMSAISWTSPQQKGNRCATGDGGVRFPEI